MVWWVGVTMLFRTEILLPAYTMEQQTGQAVEALTGAEHFAPELVPPLVRWMLLDRASPQAGVLDTNMTGPYRDAAYDSVEEVLLWASSRKKKDGQVAGLYLLLYSLGRFLLEFLRGDLERGNVGSLSTSQFISLFTAAAGALLIFRKNRMQRHE